MLFVAVCTGETEAQGRRGNTRGSGKDLNCALNRIPAAVAEFPATATAGEPIILDGLGSTDPDGDVLRFAWEIGPAQGVGGETISVQRATAEITLDEPGVYPFTLTVTDGCGATSEFQGSVEVAPAQSEEEIPPFSWLPSEPKTQQHVTFSAALGPDVVADYMWWFNDGSPTGPLAGWGTGQTFENVFLEAGTYYATLAVQKHNGEYLEFNDVVDVAYLPPMQVLDLLDGSDGHTAGVNLSIAVSEGPAPGYKTAWLGNAEGDLTTIEVAPDGQLRWLSMQHICNDYIVQVLAREGKIVVVCQYPGVFLLDGSDVTAPFTSAGGYVPEYLFRMFGAELEGNDLYVMGTHDLTAVSEVRLVDTRTSQVVTRGYDVAMPRRMLIEGNQLFVAGGQTGGHLCVLDRSTLAASVCLGQLSNAPMEMARFGDYILVVTNTSQSHPGRGFVYVFDTSGNLPIEYVSTISDLATSLRDIEVMGDHVFVSSSTMLYRFESVGGGEFQLLDGIYPGGGNLGFIVSTGPTSSDFIVGALDLWRLAISITP